MTSSRGGRTKGERDERLKDSRVCETGRCGDQLIKDEEIEGGGEEKGGGLGERMK